MFVLEGRGMGKTFGLVSYDTHQHHCEERAVFSGCGVRAVGTNELNTYRRTERKTWFFGVQINTHDHSGDLSAMEVLR